MGRTFVALGDSFTEGLHDELGPDGRHRGWADRVADALAQAEGRVRYANLAVRGRLLDEVVAEQLPAAQALGADLVSFHAGGNDVLRPGVDVDGLVARYDHAVEQLVASGAEVLLFTVIERAGGTGRLAQALAARFARFNRGVRATAAAHGAVLVDVGSLPALQDRRLWHEDRLHLAAEGHARIAGAVLQALGIRDDRARTAGPGWWRTPLPTAPRPRPVRAATEDLRWVQRHLVPWVGRRLRGVSSGDAVVCKRPQPVELVHPPATDPSPAGG